MSEARAEDADAPADRSGRGGAPLRLTDAGLKAILDRFQGSPLLGDGKINVIALDAIAERLGGRWRVRQDFVHEHAQRVLKQQLDPSAMVERISETELIVAQPDASRAAGQLRCLNGLREILHHFLGAAHLTDLRLHEVTRITTTGVFGQKIDVAAAERARDAAATLARAARADEATRPPPLDRWTLFASSSGRRIGISCSLEPVMQLKTSSRIGYRVTRRVLQLPSHAALSTRDVDALSPGDIEKIDLASIARGIDRMAASQQPDDAPPSLLLTISYTTLHSRRCRPALLALLAQARQQVRHGLIIEISGIDGAPASALPEAIAVVRPLCLHVIGRLSDGLDQDVRLLKGSGLTGLSVRCPPIDGDAQFIGWTRALVAAATRIARALFVYDLASMGHAKIAASLGVTHATLAPQRLRSHLIDDELPSGAFRGAERAPV